MYHALNYFVIEAFVQVMLNCVPFLQQLREQAMLTDSDDASSKGTRAAPIGSMRSRESLAQQLVQPRPPLRTLFAITLFKVLPDAAAAGHRVDQPAS